MALSSFPQPFVMQLLQRAALSSPYPKRKRGLFLLLYSFVASTFTPVAFAQAFRFVPQSPTIVELASTVVSGQYHCFNQQMVTVTARQDHMGYVDLTFKGQTHHMLPVVSNSGALRLETKAGGFFWLQLSTKSMLFTNAGSRIADDCRNHTAPPPPASTGQVLQIQVTDLPTAAPPPPPTDAEQKQLD